MEQRRREAAKDLLKHSLFGFQAHDAVVSERLSELKDLLMATCGEKDQIGLLSENIREIEEQLKSRSERFLLESLRQFEQDMELLLDVESGDDADETEEDSDDDQEEMEECLSLSQEAAFTATTPLSSPLPSVKSIKNNERKTEDEEMLCGVCCAPDSLENDPIVICEVCGVAVHQTCYRLAAVPEGDWFCHPCRQYMDSQDIEKSLIPTHELECEACCSKAGAMAPTIDGGWVHMACSMFLPELYVQEKHASRFQGPLDGLQVVCGMDKLKQRRKLRCCFCKKSNEKGACAQCVVGKCTVAYHALCALRNGIKLRYLEDQGQFGSGCLKHQAKFLGTDGSDVEQSCVKKSKENSNSKTSRRNSWSDDGGSESEKDDEHDLDSDSDHGGSQDSLSDDDHPGKDDHREQAQPTPTKMSPPRLLGAPPLRSSGKKQSNRPRSRRQTKLTFAAADDTFTQPTPSSSARTHLEAVEGSSSSVQLPTTSGSDKSADTNRRLVLQSNVFIPAFYPLACKLDHIDDRDFEYVMVMISSRPFGLGIASSNEGQGIHLHAGNTRNVAVNAALKRGVIQDGDEIFAFNDQVLRGSDLESFKEEVVPAVSLPARCWFRTKRKNKMSTAPAAQAAHTGGKTPVQVSINTASTPKPRDQQLVTPFASPQATFGLVSNTREGDVGVVSLGIDWPWVFLRSDGKLAMNLFWKSLDSAFFLRKINKRTLSQLQQRVEEMCGVRLSRSHSEYEQVHELLVMPRRKRMPAYLVDFRKTREQKQQFLSSDVLMGVSSEPKDAETELDEDTPLEVGTTVNVAKRTWPGMNKLGGVGRIKKVNEEIIANGRRRFTYNVAYVLSGSDRNVERKYISVVDLDADEVDKKEETSSTSTGRRHKSEPEADTKDIEETEAADTLSVSLVFALSRTAVEDQVTELPDAQMDSPPKRRRFQLQFSTENEAVHCERKTESSNPDLSARELLLHRHFSVKADDAIVNDCFSSQLLSVEDRAGDELDDDDTDNEDEEDEIKTELTTLQTELRAVIESNELVFASLTKKMEEEYASKEYRQKMLQDIEWRNYERMYQELQAAKRQFADSDEESDADEGGQEPGAAAKADSEQEDSDNEDISFGGMFVNKLKQEGSEVCALCELSGGDFTGTDSGSVVHPQCAMFTPETFFKDGVVHGINLVDPERRRLKCSICGGCKGLSKIQCAHRKCVRAYHVACAFVNGLLTRDPYYQAWCPRHLKTSGMGQFVEIPDHLNKDKSALSTAITSSETPSVTPASSPVRRKRGRPRLSQPRVNRNRKDTTPAEVTTTAPTDISSSKTNRKRKRKGSNASTSASACVSNTKIARVTRGSSPRSAIAFDAEEPRCARRLEIELSDDSDHEGKAVDAWQQGRDPLHVFNEGNVVEVLARDWRGINKPGGVARVRGVEVVPNLNGGKNVFYDVVHIVGAFKEKRLPAKFVRRYQPSDG
ncbi:PHD-zinc-finger like domain [Phytophthora infestans]|uniref:PHD-zinc-finger like domain n=1 Tax=Phytophthora infestans TaxID=4787 RepID=A0A8S9UZJ8_PHYIN|nr:PHD-zinc-finger like domain [Phytophthora infestans]